ncbi:MAG: aminopeptidase P family N-terminal domain-containing protein [Holdemanella sp.]|nr:aminopeptidase P family N-terminal domain-containing protein [Holdemanella sp.]
MMNYNEYTKEGKTMLEKVKRFQNLLKEKHIDVYYIPNSDAHDSEFLNDCFKVREYMSGFTGSSGDMVITQDKAVVWSDGRYFIQAQKQLEGTGIDFYHLNDKEYPTIEEYIETNLPENGTLGFDGKVVKAKWFDSLYKQLEYKNIYYAYQSDYVNEIWKDRPAFPMSKAFLLDVKYAGRSMESKLKDVRKEMNKRNVSRHILTTLDDIAWLLNIRGKDAESNPVLLSYVVVEMDRVILYVKEEKITDIKSYLIEKNVIVKDYEDIYDDVKTFNDVWIDYERINSALVLNMNTKLHKEVTCIEMMKAIKNEIEIKNSLECQIRDCVALTRFMKWLKENVYTETITELRAAKYLNDLRREIDDYIEVGYGQIAAYNENAAMMHYQATEANYSILKKDGIFLIDSGGQYLSGTTDITRTIGFGNVDKQWKIDFTTVLISHAQLAQLKFLEGCSGMTIDIIARQPIWERELDYQCGTGHGIGYLLGVHEGPQGIRWYKALNRKEDTILKEGMIVTNEPGIYIKGSHGIRTENEMVIRKGVKNEYGQFLYFETMTFCPIDLDLIDMDTLDKKTRLWLNAYHKQVFEKLSPYMNKEEVEWLRHYTREI